METEPNNLQDVLRSFAGLVWRLSISPVTFVVLALLWCLDLGAGSLLADQRPDLFASMDAYPFAIWLKTEGARAWPQSLWVHLLVVLSMLMIVSLLLCTVNWLLYRRKRLEGMGEVLVHLGFLLVFGGFVIGSAYGARTLGVKIPAEGGRIEVPGFHGALTLKGLTPLKSSSGEIQGVASDLELSLSMGTTRDGRVMINHPLMAGSIVVYPRGTAQTVEGAKLLVSGLGQVQVSRGQVVRLNNGRTLELVGVLQQDEERGQLRGPGVGVAFKSPGASPQTVYLSTADGMPAEVQVGGIQLSLMDFSGPVFAVYDVHHDPGIRLVIAGALLIAIGSIWALWGYLRSQPAAAPVA